MTRQQTREWLRHNRFFEVTGMPAANGEFCLERRQKRCICEALQSPTSSTTGSGAGIPGRLGSVRYLIGRDSDAPPAEIIPITDWRSVATQILG